MNSEADRLRRRADELKAEVKMLRKIIDGLRKYISELLYQKKEQPPG